MKHYDVIVIGGGHAGVEAAAAACRLRAHVVLVTHDLATIGAMSCNPSIGGVGKGHLVREVDALDGLIGCAADASAIHYRMLNRSKGVAVHGPRVQADRDHFKASIREQLAGFHVDLLAGSVAQLAFRSGKAAGVVLDDGSEIAGRTVVIASGTFLNGKMFRGFDVEHGGRTGEQAATELGNQLRSLGLPIGRLKTGTPPRIDGRTIDWSRLSCQPSDLDRWTMSPLGTRNLPSLFCAVTRTNVRTHDVIRIAMAESPMVNGAIVGPGPRYCPSIEDKVSRFGDRDGHQIYLEPEGLRSSVVYPNGISTSLSVQAQHDLVQTLDGLETARIVTPGYAVEYDYVDPRSLTHTLALAALPEVFLAGQINGTTGYEEAAAQGLVAGANAALSALDRPPFELSREQSYIGVMIDDLVLQGASEPYRMLTSRAEHRLALRADNAATRLTPIGLDFGLVGAGRRTWWQSRDADLRAAQRGEKPATSVSDEIRNDRLYAPYVERQRLERARLSNADAISLPADFSWAALAGLSNEMVDRLSRARPRTFGEVRRVRGVTPAALAAVMVAMRGAHG